jgi:hypothetical protein
MKGTDVPRRIANAADKKAAGKKPINVKRARRKRGEPPSPPHWRKQNKYRNKGCYHDEIYFPSKAEGERYLQLKAIEAKGWIAALELQPTYVVVVNNKQVCRYRADFRYNIIDDRGTVLRHVVEDVKGMTTPLYKLKAKLVKATLNVDITEIPAGLIKKWEGQLP